MPSHRRPPALSLDSLQPDEQVWVVGIVGRKALRRCRELDLMEGDRVICLRSTPNEIVLQQSHGGIVRLERELARRVEVDREPSARGRSRDRSAPGTGPSSGTSGAGPEDDGRPT